MVANKFSKKAVLIVFFFVMFFSGYPPNSLVNSPAGQGNGGASPILSADAAAKTKTIVFFVGTVVSTTAIASGATTTFSFTISLPDMVPDTQPIRSAYISYNAWQNNLTGITASSFSLNQAPPTANPVQVLTSPTLTGGTTEQQLSIRLNATAAMQEIVEAIPSAETSTRNMVFTANLTGPTLISSGAELYITYDYNPLASLQLNTVYHWVYSSSTLLSTTKITSPTFNFNLPENAPTTTFAGSGHFTNDFWIEYRGFISTSSNVTASVGWNAEATSAVTFAETTQQFSFLILSVPITASTAPTANNTFSMISSVTNGIVAPTALAIATYSYNFASSTKLRKTIQVLLMQSTSTNSTATINTTTTINIPEGSPSSTDAFLLGRLAFSTSSAPGINAYMTTSTCTVPVTTNIATATKQTNNTGFLTAAQYIYPSSSIKTSGNWNICSSFTRQNAANIPGLELFLSYDFTNNFASNTLFNTNLSFLGQSNMSPTGTTFAATGINTSIANASATANYSWLDSEFDNNAPGTSDQIATLGIGAATNNYDFIAANSSARRQGSTFSATSSSGFASNVTTTVQCSVACIDDAAYDVFGFTQMLPANFTQNHFHWRLNNGSESAASSSAPEDTATSTFAGTINRLRIEINNAGDATTSAAFRLEYQANGTSSAWTQVATSSIGSAAWQMATSSQVTDGTSTTQIATSTGGTDAANIFFIPGYVLASTSYNQTTSTIITGTQFTEDEFAIIATTNAATNTTYYFRVSNAGTALTTYTIYPSIQVIGLNPTVTGVVLNGGSDITLTPNATTSITVAASTTDPSGPGNIISATAAIYRTSLGANCQGNYLNCYQMASSSCTFSGSTSTVTCTAGLWYYAQSTGNTSSSYPSDSWTGAITVTNGQGTTGTGTSTAQNVNVLTAINITTSSIDYGTVLPDTDTGSVNQNVTVQNAGNSSTTLQVSGTALLNGTNSIATSSEHYATSSFIFGGGEQLLNGSPTTVSGFLLQTLTFSLAVAVPLPTGITDMPAVVNNGYIYTLGGHGQGSGATSTINFAPINSTGSLGAWSSTTVLPAGTYEMPAVVNNGYIYILGGINVGATSTVNFAPINSTGSLGAWSSTTALPTITYDMPAVVNNGYIYVFGGETNVGITSTVNFAPINSTGSLGAWSSTTALPAALHSFPAVVNNGYIYTLSGSGVSATSTVNFAPINSTGSLGAWSSTTALPAALHSFPAVVNNGYIYTLGGSNSTIATSTINFAPINSTGSLGAWSTITAFPTGTQTMPAVVNNGYIYILGGIIANGTTVTSTVHYYSPQSPTGTTYWGLSVPGGSVTGTYSGTVTFTSLFSQ